MTRFTNGRFIKKVLYDFYLR